MAMISCAECGGDVSTEAKSCPHCGAKARAFKRRPVSPLWTVLGVIAVLLIIFADGPAEDSSDSTRSSAASRSPTASTAVAYAPDATIVTNGKSFQVSALCAAAIAGMMRRPLDIVNAEIRAEYVYVHYTRQDDGTYWDYKCKVVGDRVHWGKPDGRWRDHPADDVLRYKIADDALVIYEEIDGHVIEHRKYPLTPANS